MTEINGTCHNCGLLADAIRPRQVRSVQITHKAENEYQRDGGRKVWCCSKECAIQTLAIAKYGPRTHKWPITLAQFRGTKPESAKTFSTMPRNRVTEAVAENLSGV